MAQRELQVTALRPAAAARETYVRPEFENNQAAINRLTQSIKSTNDTRSKTQAHIDEVKEALAGGVEDPNDRTGWSTNPVYVSKRLEMRGETYGQELATQISTNYAGQFRDSAADNGQDLEPWLNEQFAPSIEALGDNPFLLAGAHNVLGKLKSEIRVQHMSHLDERAKAETLANVGFTVDRIIQGKVKLDLPDGGFGEMNYYDKVKALDTYALDMASTTHLTKGQANESIFNHIIAMAESLDPEDGINYLTMASELRYAKAGDNAVNPKAALAIEQAEERIEAAARRNATAKAAADKTKKQQVATELKSGLVDSLLDAQSQGAVLTLTKEIYGEFSDAGIDATKVNTLYDSMLASFERDEHKMQRDNWMDFSSSLHALRGSPQGIRDLRENLTDYITNGNLHHSRYAEAQTLLKEMETAAPWINHTLLADPMKRFVKSLVPRETEFDLSSDVKEKQFTDEWQSLATAAIAQHYYVDPKDPNAPTPSAPSHFELQAMAQSIESQMRTTHAQLAAEGEARDGAVIEWNSGIKAAMSASATADTDDGVMNIGWWNGVGTADLTSFIGSTGVEAITEHKNQYPLVGYLVNTMLVDPTYTFDWGNKQFGVGINQTAAQHFDRVYGAGAFAMYWKRHGGSDRNTRQFTQRDAAVLNLKNAYIQAKSKRTN